MTTSLIRTLLSFLPCHFSVLVGGAAGAIVAVREATRPSEFRGWVTAASIAVLAASMGCIRLGIASIVGVALGVVVGRAASLRMSATS